MTPELLNAIAQGGASAVLLGVVILTLIPRTMRMVEALTARFSVELHEERASHAEELNDERQIRREDTRLLVAAFDGLCKATTDQTKELQHQTILLQRLERNMTEDMQRMRVVGSN